MMMMTNDDVIKATLSTKTVSYDHDIYGGGGGGEEYNTELTIEDEESAVPSKYSTESRDVVRRYLLI